MSQPVKPYRVGLVLLNSRALNEKPLKYLILRLNSLQESLEFEFLPATSDPYLAQLASKKPLHRQSVRDATAAFAARYREWLKSQAIEYGLQHQETDHVIVVSEAKFVDNFYTLNSPAASIIALGNWSRAMAPPSFLEFVYVIAVRIALGAWHRELGRNSHYGTRGCLFDFDAFLSDVRYKVLNANLCSSCTTSIELALGDKVVQDVKTILDKSWFGSPLKGTPAAILAKLKYDLFQTSGIKQTLTERLLRHAEQEGVKQLLDFAGKLALAAAIFWLGLNVARATHEKSTPHRSNTQVQKLVK